jgi:hypothetical protein
LCSVPGCEIASRSRSAELCEMHYARLRRTGSVEGVGRHDETSRRVLTNGYISVLRIGHPLTGANGWMTEHRQVAYDDRNGVLTSCEWCRVPLSDWAEVQIDHIDGDRANNAPSNLLVSCASCNTGRHVLHYGVEGWVRLTAERIVLRDRADEVQREVARLNAMHGAETG